jgi:hypothetical protein
MANQATVIHGVMEGGGSYNRHAGIPAGGSLLALPLLEQAVRNVTLDSGQQPVVVADYGCSQGKNSLTPMRAAIKALRKRLGPDRPVSIVHVDQAANDFNTLFDVIHTDPERYSVDDPAIFSSAIGRSFYEAVFPREHVHLGWSSYAAVWLSRIPMLGCLVHTTAMLSHRGIPAQTAALGSSLVGAAVLLGRVGTGYLLDQLFAPRVAAVFFAGTALGIILLWLGTTPLAFAGAFLVGLGLGAEVDLIAYLISRYFGLRDFGKIYSFAFAAFVLAGALGPLLMGASFDRTGTYRGALTIFLAATLVAAVLMFRLGPYRYRAGQSEDPVSDGREVAQRRNS